MLARSRFLVRRVALATASPAQTRAPAFTRQPRYASSSSAAAAAAASAHTTSTSTILAASPAEATPDPAAAVEDAATVISGEARLFCSRARGNQPLFCVALHATRAQRAKGSVCGTSPPFFTAAADAIVEGDGMVGADVADDALMSVAVEPHAWYSPTGNCGK
jgi:hypothetical protein